MSQLAYNKTAAFNHEITEKYTAGIVLIGHEAKSIRQGRFDLTGSRVLVRNGELWLTGASIPSFQPNNAPAEYDTTRSRKLLLKDVEILELINKLNAGLTLLPLRAYTERGFIKVELGLGRSRKKHDKREAIKKRDVERDLRRMKPSEH